MFAKAIRLHFDEEQYISILPMDNLYSTLINNKGANRNFTVGKPTFSCDEKF